MLKIIYRAENLIDGNLIKGMLESEGVPAFVNGEGLIGGIGELPAHDLVTVGVPGDFEAQALALLEDFNTAEIQQQDQGAEVASELEPPGPILPI